MLHFHGVHTFLGGSGRMFPQEKYFKLGCSDMNPVGFGQPANYKITAAQTTTYKRTLCSVSLSKCVYGSRQKI